MVGNSRGSRRRSEPGEQRSSTDFEVDHVRSVHWQMGLNIFVPALLHFLVAEISPVYLAYGGGRSFIVKMALARERIRVDSILGFDVIKEGKQRLTAEQLNGMTFEERAMCVKAGVQGAIWSLNPYYVFEKEGTVCFSPFRVWGVPNFLGLLHIASLVVNFGFLLYWSVAIINGRIWSWTDARYFVFTWQLEETPEYKVLAHFDLGFALFFGVFAFVTLYTAAGWDGLYQFVLLTWAELLAMIGAARSLMGAWTPPYQWQDQTFAQCTFIRDATKFHQHNDDFGRTLEDALLNMAIGKKEKLSGMLTQASIHLWPHILYSNESIMEGRHQALQPLVKMGQDGSQRQLLPNPNLQTGPMMSPRSGPRDLQMTAQMGGQAFPVPPQQAAFGPVVDSSRTVQHRLF